MNFDGREDLISKCYISFLFITDVVHCVHLSVSIHFGKGTIFSIKIQKLNV